MSAASKGLGKGLSALMAEDYSQQTGTTSVSHDTVKELPINALTSGQFQPRQFFDDTYLNELAESIRSNGIMQPILVRALSSKKNGAGYEIVAGERRWRASKLAGLQKVPVLIKELEDNKALEMALVENIQRQDLNALEESEGYQQLINQFSYTQEALSKVVGKSRSYVANALRLLGLSDSIKQYLNEGKISAGHARALITAENPDDLAKDIIELGLNVRQTELLVKTGALTKEDITEQVNAPIETLSKQVQNKLGLPSRTGNFNKSNGSKDPDILALEETLSGHIGVAVNINDRNGKGEVALSYSSLTELDDILRRLGGAL